MPNKPSITFTESEVRLALIIGIVTGRPINEITNKIIAVTANNRTETNKITGKQEQVDGTSQIATAITSLRNAGYISNH